MKRNCPDCGVAPGVSHDAGCDVARCTECGWQRISCDHLDSDLGWGQVWTGQWPGDAECRALGMTYANGEPMLNELAMWARMGLLTWDKTRHRWDRPRVGTQ